MNLMDLMIAVGVEDNASSALSGIAGNAKSVVSGIGTGLANAAKVGTAAIAGMTAGVGALTKASVENYAQFEQLVGGVETLFGHGGKTIEEYAASVGKTVDQVADAYQYMQDSIDAVLGDADAAFRTAGLSANEYMETITSFAASLNQALGGDTMAASKLANQTIIDMADNANKMGSSMSSIQNAYMGFAKQNYSMLDNLKLGYGGTQEEMYRLMEDAAKLNEEFAATADFWMDSKGHLWTNFADVSKAIHIIQEDMGIMGTTAEEAAETISGSMASAKSALDNLLTGFADENADLGVLVDNLVDSVITVADNLLPRIGQAVDGIITSFGELIGVDLSGVAEKVGEFGDKAIEAAKGIMEAFSEGGIFGVFGEITQMFQQVTGIDVSFLTEKFDAIGAAVGRIQEAIGEDGFGGGITAFIEEFAGLTGVDISGFVDGIGWFIDTVSSAAPEILDSVGKGIQGILAPFQEHAGPIISAVGTAFREIVDFILGADHSRIASVGVGIGKVFEPIVGAIPETIENVKNGIKTFLGILLGTDGNALSGIGNAITTIFSPMTEAVGSAMETISGKFDEIMEYAADSNFGTHLRKIADAATDLFTNFSENLSYTITTAADALSHFGSSLSKDTIDEAERYANALTTIFNVLANLGNLGTDFSVGLVEAATANSKAYDRYERGEITYSEYMQEVTRNNEEYFANLALDSKALFGNMSKEEASQKAVEDSQASSTYYAKKTPVLTPTLPGTDNLASSLLNDSAVEDAQAESWYAGQQMANGMTQGFTTQASSQETQDQLRQALNFYEKYIKDENEIKSPSRRYARIGKFMAQGISVGWLEGMKDVERDIAGSMDFSTGNVSFSESASGKSSTGMINSLIASSEDGGQTLNVNVYLDGELVARNQYGYLRNIAKQKGEPVNA